MTDDNQVILDRAADSCRALDDIRYKLYTIQKQLAQARAQSGGAQQDTLSKVYTDNTSTNPSIEETHIQQGVLVERQVLTLLFCRYGKSS